MSCIERGEKEVISWGWSPSLAAKACCSGSVSLRAEPWTVLRFLYPLKTLHWQSHVYVCMCVCMPLRLAGTILCEPVGSSLPGSSVHDIFQARILEWISISFSRGSFWPGIKATSLVSPALAGRFFTSVWFGHTDVHIKITVVTSETSKNEPEANGC